MLNEHGGIWGRKVTMTYQDDGYQPSRAVTAAQQCADTPGGIFMLLGGIGFDQIPAVRIWAEQHHMPYIHHIATQAGTAGLRYSYTMLPTLEQVGVSFGQYYLSRDAGVPIGIIYRNSSNWDPGRITFENTLKAAGQGASIVDEESVNNNQGDYSAEIIKLQSKGAKVVFIWENALAAENIIQQAHNQSYNPKWLLFPFNLTLKTLDQAGVDTSQMDGIVPWPAYTCNASNLPEYSAYRAELREFEAAYARYDSGANLCGDGGDLLFGAWEAWKQIGDLLTQCGRDCTRNRLVGLMLNGYHATIGATCTVDFRGGDGHHSVTGEDFYKVKKINGAAAWYNTALCVNNR
jgi:ABC-type branched-subunit amino acid transport system substrate-binding protein